MQRKLNNNLKGLRNENEHNNMYSNLKILICGFILESNLRGKGNQTISTTLSQGEEAQLFCSRLTMLAYLN